MKNRLVNYFKACYPGVAIQTFEEQRAIEDVIAAAKECGKAVLTWSATEGLVQIRPTLKKFGGTEEMTVVCTSPDTRVKKAVYILRDVSGLPFDRDWVMARAFKDLLMWGPENGSCLVVVAPEYKPHATFEKLVVVTDYDLPGPDALLKIAQGIAKSGGIEINGNGDDVIRALSGMSTAEAENALALSIVETAVVNEKGEVTDPGRLDPTIIYREKVQAVKKSGLLSIIEPDPRGIDGIGGLDVLKDWLKKRKRAFSKAASEFSLTAPKGILLVGVPGVGKSLSAKAVGTILGEPEMYMDLGAMFNSLVGESEARMRAALALAEALAPCTVWIDEIDKGLAGSGGSGANDSGVTKRVFGTLISWMQERKRPVFIVATANDVTNLPSEFLRRWDKIFAMDIPNRKERAEIFKIHLEKRKRSATLTTDEVIKATEGYTGAEIEKVVDEALYNAFDLERDLTAQDLVDAVGQVTPLIVTAREKIEEIRNWVSGRATLASLPETVEETTTTIKRRIGK